MSKRAEEKVNCFEGGCPSVSLSLHCTLAGGVGDPEVVPFWNSLIIKILCDKSNLFIYFQEQYFVRHSGTAFLRFPVATSPCTCASWPYPLPSFKCYAAAVDLPVTGARIQFVVRVSPLLFLVPIFAQDDTSSTGVDCEVKTGIQQSAKILRCTATGHWSFELSSGGADNKLYCGDQKYNYFVSYLFLHHNSSDKSRHPDRTTTMSGVQLLQLDGGGWPRQITLQPSTGQAQEERKVQRERARTWMCRPRLGNSWWCQELRIYLRSRWGCLFRIGQILCIPVEFHLHSVVESGVCRFIWRDEEEMNE